MARASQSLVIDLVGVLLVGASVSVGAWFVLGPPKDAAASLGPRRARAAALEEEVSNLRLALSRARTNLAQAQEKVATLGSLPQTVPIERDLDALAAVARSCQLVIAEVTPHGVVEYPGVRELQYTIKGEGGFLDWLAFLHAFESQKCWADITHLKLDTGKLQAANSPLRPRAELTISFYAAHEMETMDGGAAAK